MGAWRSDLERNRAIWAVVNEQFTDAAADDAWRSAELGWGLFARPESELGILGDVAGLDVVDLAGGTGYVAAALRRKDARVLSLDLSWEQLMTAQRCQRAYGPVFPLVQADAEHLPLRSAAYDLVLSEHGAAAWCDPDAWVGEAARVLRPGGRLVFLTNSLLSALCVPAEEGTAQERLLRGQRDVRRVQACTFPWHRSSQRVLEKVGTTRTPQPVLAVASMRPAALDDLAIDLPHVHVPIHEDLQARIEATG